MAASLSLRGRLAVHDCETQVVAHLTRLDLILWRGGGGGGTINEEEVVEGGESGLNLSWGGWGGGDPDSIAPWERNGALLPVNRL